jgi:hypothetical protein
MLEIEGKSYAEMAELRQTSKRTVANQLAAAFHRLRISGRAELLGEDSARLSNDVRTRVGLVSEGHPLYERMRVDQALAFEAGTQAGKPSLNRGSCSQSGYRLGEPGTLIRPDGGRLGKCRFFISPGV